MQWVQIKRFASVVAVCLLAVVSVATMSQPVSADAITGKNNDGLANQTERWLRFRAISKCFQDNDVGQNSYNDVVNGEFFDSGGVAIGYLNEDGKVSCDDGAFVKNTFGILGFGNTVDAFCSVQPMAQRFKDNFGSNDYSDTKTESNFEGCTSGSGDTLDMDSDALNQGARQLDQFRKGYLDYAGKNGFAATPWDPQPQMMYHVYRESLMRFCGAKLIGKYNEADKNNIAADKRKVVVNDVDLATGDIVQNVYSLTRDQTDKIDDIYVNASMQNVSNVTCGDMAQKTWAYDEDMAKYVKAYNTRFPEDAGQGYGDEGDGATTDAVCSAGALGWIFCPLSNFMADAITGIAEFLEGFLIFEPITIGPKGDALRAMWGIVVVIANVGLIITFLFVAFSQATSIGISSYGVKKLLPKIIAAAILINLSFYICAAAVDISNILGVSIKPIVEAGIAATNLNKTPDAQVGASFGQNAVVLTGAVLAGAIIIGTGAFALLLPVFISALLAILTAFAIIAAREVILTLLIIVAPLAFLAAILPNTEGWFTKWRKLFTTLLLMFPLIMIVFYGSVLVSSLIMATHTNKTGAENIQDFMVNVFAFAVLILPLFSLPFIMKSAGGIMDRLGVLVNNRNRGLVDRSRKKGQEAFNNSAFQRSRNARVSERQARRSRDFYESMAGSGRKGARKRMLGRAGYTGMGAGMITSGGRQDARRTGENIRDLYRKQQTEATARNLASLVEGGAFSQGTTYTLRARNGDVSTFDNHRDMVDATLRAGSGSTLSVTDVAGRTRDYNSGDIGGALMSKTAQMGDVPLTERVLAQGGETAAGMREFISYNAGSYATKAPDYIKGAAGAFGDPKAAELAGWHAETATRAATYASQRPEAARSIGAALTEALNNDNLRGEMTTGSVRNLIGQEDSAIWHSLSTEEQQSVRDFMNSHQSTGPTPPTGGGTSGTPNPNVPPGASGGYSGSTGPSGLWTPGQSGRNNPNPPSGGTTGGTS